MEELYILLLLGRNEDASRCVFVGPFDDVATAAEWAERRDRHFDWQLVRGNPTQPCVVSVDYATVRYFVPA